MTTTPGNVHYLTLSEITPDQRRGARQLYVDLFNLQQEALPPTFSENDEDVRGVQEAIDYLSLHAQTTLYPPASADRYAPTIRGLGALHTVYVESRPIKEIADGSISRTRQGDLQKRGLKELRKLLAGDPDEGWMDGAPIDNLRHACIPYLSDADAITYQNVLEVRSNMAEYNYTLGDTSIRLLPLTADLKHVLGRSNIRLVGQIPKDLYVIRGLGPTAETELGIVLNALTSPHDGRATAFYLSHSVFLPPISH